MSAAVWLVTGAQASGKSTVADLLAHRFDLGVHVPEATVDEIVARAGEAQVPRGSG